MFKVYLLGALLLACGAFPATAAHADPRTVTDSGATTDSSAATDYGKGCVIDPASRAVTIDSLRRRCTVEQGKVIYTTARAGSVPSGAKNGWVTESSAIQPVTPPFWIGKTFDTGPDGGRLLNRVTRADIPGWPAYVYRGPSRIDGEPTWVLDYTPAVTPQVYDEIREVVPGVWFGYSWWRGEQQTPLLLSFVLA
ncbi:hypothetical protein [Nocardia sp. X0981]